MNTNEHKRVLHRDMIKRKRFTKRAEPETTGNGHIEDREHKENLPG